MKTKTIKVCKAHHIVVDCMENDSVDIRAGGPAILGYDFYISFDKDVEKYKKFIRKCLKKYDRPFISFSTYVAKDFNVKHLWTKKNIKKTIKKYGIW